MGWTLVHFLWQGPVVAVLYAVVHIRLRKQAAHARYLLGCIALLVLLASPIATFMVTGAHQDFGTSFSVRAMLAEQAISPPQGAISDIRGQPVVGRDFGAGSGPEFWGRRKAGGALVTALVAVIFISLCGHPSGFAEAEAKPQSDPDNQVKGTAADALNERLQAEVELAQAQGRLAPGAETNPDSSKPPVFQVRLVLEGPSAEAEQMTLERKINDATAREVLYVQRTVLLDQTGVKSASVTPDPATVIL